MHNKITHNCKSCANKMNKLKVLIANPDTPNFVTQMLLERNFIVDKCTTSPGPIPAELKSKLPGTNALIWWPNAGNPYRNLTKEHLDLAGPNLRAICTCSVGIDSIDIFEVKRRHIKLSNMAQVQDNAVADMAVLLLLAASRRMYEFFLNKSIMPTWFGADWLMGVDLQESTVGIIGLGGIGQAIMTRLKGFQVHKFLYCGHKPKSLSETHGAEFVTLNELLRHSDFVVIACPLTVETQNMFNRTTFQQMKRKSVLINIARGAIINNNDLAEALENGVIWAAGLDVTDPEPIPSNHKLLTLPNCVLMPHKGSQTLKTREKMFKLAVENIILALDGQTMRTPVDL